MKDEHIWREIQSSMAIEGWNISDEQLKKIAAQYEESGQEEALRQLIAEIGVNASLKEHKAAWERMSQLFTKHSRTE